MVTDTHKISRENQKASAELLAEHPDFPSLRPYLSKETMNLINTPGPFRDVMTFNSWAATDGFLEYVLNDIDRASVEWGVDTRLQSRLAENDQRMQEQLKTLETENTQLKGINSKLEEQLEKPNLVPKTLRYKAAEVVPKNEAIITSKTLGIWTGNYILLSVFLHVENASRVETKALSFGAEIRHGSDKSGRRFGTLTHTDPELSQLVKYAVPVSGWLTFRFGSTDERAVLREEFVVVVNDGLGKQTSTEPCVIEAVSPYAQTDAPAKQLQPEVIRTIQSSGELRQLMIDAKSLQQPLLAFAIMLLPITVIRYLAG